MKIIPIEDTGDERGSSFFLAGLVGDWIQRPADCHVADIATGFVRGNHCHTQRREVIIVRYSSEWTLFWDEGAETSTRSKSIQGSGAVVIHVKLGWSHAIANTGKTGISVVSLSDQAYDGVSNETQRRIVASTDESGRLVGQ